MNGLTRKGFIAAILASPLVLILKAGARTISGRPALSVKMCFNCRQCFTHSKWLPSGALIRVDGLGRVPIEQAVFNLYALCDRCIEEIQLCSTCHTELPDNGGIMRITGRFYAHPIYTHFYEWRGVIVADCLACDLSRSRLRSSLHDGV